MVFFSTRFAKAPKCGALSTVVCITADASLYNSRVMAHVPAMLTIELDLTVPERVQKLSDYPDLPTNPQPHPPSSITPQVIPWPKGKRQGSTSQEARAQWGGEGGAY